MPFYNDSLATFTHSDHLNNSQFVFLCFLMVDERLKLEQKEIRLRIANQCLWPNEPTASEYLNG